MTVSRQRRRFKVCDARKVVSGRFLTCKNSWLKPQVESFIRQTNPARVLDPFAGKGHLLRVVGDLLGCDVAGLDVQGSEWPHNDSLVSIPPVEHGLIVTNPPYLAKHSARRKGVAQQVWNYYERSGRDDLYQIAMDRCLEACPRVVAIVPETVLNSGYDLSHAVSISILHENPFEDTENPVCVVCLDRNSRSDPEIYVDDRVTMRLSRLNSLRLRPRGTTDIRFNIPNGRIGLRAVDMPDPLKPIQFMPREELGYDPSGIKVSSRLVTFVEIPGVGDSQIQVLCHTANRLLDALRRDTFSLFFSPFKGNNKMGERRRRLDYATARALLECAVNDMGAVNGEGRECQMELFG
jgi:hypothetical protein